MRIKILQKITDLVTNKPWLTLLGIFIITVVSVFLASTLKINPNMQALLPQNNPIAKEYDKIFENFEGVNTIFVVVEGQQQKMVNYAEEIESEILNLEMKAEDQDSSIDSKAYAPSNGSKINENKEYFALADYKKPVSFIKNHGMMLMDSSDIARLQGTFEHPNLLPMLTEINNSLESKYIRSDKKLSTIQRERQATQYLDGMETFINNFDKAIFTQNNNYSQKAAEGLVVGSPYLLSPDRNMLLIKVKPTFSIMNMGKLRPAVNRLDRLVQDKAKEYGIKAGLAGGPVLMRDEMRAINEDSYTLTILALIAVFILFVIAFRMFSSPFLAVLNLLIGITWSLGINALFIDQLNLFTAMFSVILVGLGIDFSIHIISLFTEHKFVGKSPEKALETSLIKAGRGIITGGITTAAAFLTLVVLRSKGMKELGLVTGIGLLIVMASTLIVLPTFLILRERIWNNNSVETHRDISFNLLGKVAQQEQNNWKVFLPIIIVLTIGFGIMSTQLSFDYNYLNMEPEGLQSIELNKKIIDKFNMSSDVTRFTAESIQQSYEMSEEAKTKSSVSQVESIADYVPPQEKQNRRKMMIRKIHNNLKKASVDNEIDDSEFQQLLDQLYRLEANIIEMQDMAFIGGQDMVDDKAARLVGDANLSRARLKLESLLEKNNVKLEQEKLSNIIEMLDKGKRIQSPEVEQKLDSIIIQEQTAKRVD